MTDKTKQKGVIPGEEGVFIFVLIDMAVFFFLFVSYVVERLKSPALYIESQAQLSFDVGTFNTLVLLTSSWFIVIAIRALEQNKRQLSLCFIALTIICGGLFGISKLFEYQAKINVGITMLTNDFFMFYYMMTALHFVHVFIGTIVLATMFVRIRNGKSGLHGLESSATYWHMVDLLWIFIFPLLYVMR